MPFPKRDELTVYKGSIGPGLIITWGSILAGIAMCMLGTFNLITGAGLLEGWACVVTGILIAGFMAPSLSSTHVVSWTTAAVEGPSTPFGPTLGFKRASIPWRDIAKTGTTLSGYWYIQSNDGTRIFWSRFYKNCDLFNYLIMEKRPDLKLDFTTD
jgi:hypothetical protein